LSVEDSYLKVMHYKQAVLPFCITK